MPLIITSEKLPVPAYTYPLALIEPDTVNSFDGRFVSIPTLSFTIVNKELPECSIEANSSLPVNVPP